MPTPQEREEALFRAASELPPGVARKAFLDQACAGDAALRQRLEALLAAHEQPDEALLATQAQSALPTVKVEVPDEALGTRISHYKLLQKVGEGGCGVVYMAEQEEPVRRRVALKVIRLGMDTKSVVARFEAERQALAMMDHPNIAKVLDAGTTETGRPYFVMELVRGIKITDYCDQNHLTTEARLELFISICQAVQHAHQKGIIHRDLKPSNILVTLHDGVPVPKVIDFGIAKAVEQKLTDKTLFTELHQFIGTPAYMSPEQAEMSGLDIDTRSDIYSLGVLLYELLTGQTPFDAQELIKEGLDAIRRTIREVEPPRPSTRLSTLGDADLDTVAKARGTGTLGLRSQLRGDLDWIVMKCLEKDRTRRYDTANGLAMDLKRHLNDEPVVACPPSRLYEFQKTVRRHKFGFAAAAAIIFVLAAGITLTTWQAVRATQAERRARRTVEELRSTAPAFAEQARALVAQSKLDEAIAKLDYAIQLRPDVSDYLMSKANLLQCQLKLSEAAALYHAVLKVVPDEPRARANLKLTEELISAQSANQGKLSSQELAKLLSAMQTEQRSAAELLPVSERLGHEKDILLAYWLDRLKELSIPADRPLKQRLSTGETGRLVLDLSGTAIIDLSPLIGMPLGWLSLDGCRKVSDLSPLRGMPLRTLSLSWTAVTNLAPLEAIRTLVILDLQNTKITSLDPLRGLKLQNLDLTGCENITDIQPLSGMPLSLLYLRSTRVTSLSPLRGMPLKALDLTFVPATDFEALSGLPLENVYLQSVKVDDLSFLKGMPLKQLTLWNAPGARGYSVLADIKTLEVLMLPQNVFDLPEKELQAINGLEQHPGLKQIGNEVRNSLALVTETGPKEQFWRQWKIRRDIGRGQFQAAEEALLEQLRKAQQESSPPSTSEDLAALRKLLASYSRAVGAGKGLKLKESFLTLCEKQLPPENAEVAMGRQLLGEAYVGASRLADALPLLAAASAADRGDTMLAMKAAVLQAWFGDRTHYESTCHLMQEFAKRRNQMPDVEQVAKLSCHLAGVDPSIYETAVQLGHRAVDLDPNSPWSHLALGMAEYRNRQFPAAEQALAAATRASAQTPKDWRPRVEGFAGFYRAMSLYQSGHPDDARRLFSETESNAQWLLGDELQPLSKITNPDEFYLWYDDLAIWLVYKEAKAVLNETKAVKP